MAVFDDLCVIVPFGDDVLDELVMAPPIACRRGRWLRGWRVSCSVPFGDGRLRRGSGGSAPVEDAGVDSGVIKRQGLSGDAVVADVVFDAEADPGRVVRFGGPEPVQQPQSDGGRRAALRRRVLQEVGSDEGSPVVEQQVWCAEHLGGYDPRAVGHHAAGGSALSAALTQRTRTLSA